MGRTGSLARQLHELREAQDLSGRQCPSERCFEMQVEQCDARPSTTPMPQRLRAAGGSEGGALAAAAAGPWRGPNRRYDILKKGTIAALALLALTLGQAGLLSSRTSHR